MRPEVEVRALDDAEALGAIERALHGKLRAHRLSESFIERHGEEAMQQGIAEYERALARGSEVENPGGWIVSTAYRRAIDELRRELREIDEADPPAAAAGLVNSSGLFSPTEEEAIDNVSADQLREAIAKLTAEQRQALGLYYFEEHTTRETAALLGCGETTVRRHLRSAMRVLRERFGVVPEPDSELAIEIGFLAWASLAGARVVPSQGFLNQLIAAADAAREAAAGVLGRGRDLAARVLASGGGETVGAAAGSPLGKVGGLCAGALAACALTGVVGPGVGGVDLIGGGANHPAHRQITRAHRPAPRPLKVAAPVPAPPPAPRASAQSTPSSSTTSHHRTSGSSAEERTKQATEAATSQFGVESAAPEASYSPPPEPTESTSTSTSSSSPTQIANEQFSP